MKNLNLNQIMTLYCFGCPNLEFTTKRLRYVAALATDPDAGKCVFNLSNYINQDGVSEWYEQIYFDIRDFFSPENAPVGVTAMQQLQWDTDSVTQDEGGRVYE